jgi:hypothetical protein
MWTAEGWRGEGQLGAGICSNLSRKIVRRRAGVRYSAALVPWTKKELERLEVVWVQAYKWAWSLPRTTASDVFTLPVGMEYLRPSRRDGAGIMPPLAAVP